VRIVFPVSLPGILTVVIFAFSLCVNEFIYAFTFISTSEHRTISAGVPNQLIRGDVFFWQSLMAATLIPSIVLALLYTFVRGAFLGLAIGLLYLAFHRYKYLVYGIPLVLVAALFIPSGAALTSAVFSSSSLQERTLSWGDRLDLFAENPFGTASATPPLTVFNSNPGPSHFSFESSARTPPLTVSPLMSPFTSPSTMPPFTVCASIRPRTSSTTMPPLVASTRMSALRGSCSSKATDQ